MQIKLFRPGALHFSLRTCRPAQACYDDLIALHANASSSLNSSSIGWGIYLREANLRKSGLARADWVPLSRSQIKSVIRPVLNWK
jgi:hypothetical protein